MRDPDGEIFSDQFLLRIFNDEQQQLFGTTGPVQNVKSVRTHPEFRRAYTHEFEWQYSDHENGDVYEVGFYSDSYEMTYLYVWEAEQLKAYGATTSEQGDVYTQPWEAWLASSFWFPPPIPMPSDFAGAVFVSYDRVLVEPISKRELINFNDSTWKTLTGEPFKYWRDQKNNNWIRLYPLPTLTWQDSEEASGDPDEAEYGDSVVDVDANVLVVYVSDPEEITGGSSESTLPRYLQKYVEYGTAARALRANTDGRIESLADYWDMRKKAGYEVVKKWKRLKMTDRDIRIRTRGGGGTSFRPRHPRLPTTYPDPWV